MSETFIDQLLDGHAFLHDIDAWVEQWHDGATDQEIWDFLGMTPQEYALWVEQPSVLRFIVASREREQPVEDVLAAFEKRELVAARAEDFEQADAVSSWLRRTGRLK